MNDFKNVCERILENSNKIELTTLRGKKLRYIVNDKIIHFIGISPSINKPLDQSIDDISMCIEARKNNLGPSEYPGRAQSYKWALLNHEAIWIEEKLIQ